MSSELSSPLFAYARIHDSCFAILVSGREDGYVTSEAYAKRVVESRLERYFGNRKGRLL